MKLLYHANRLAQLSVCCGFLCYSLLGCTKSNQPPIVPVSGQVMFESMPASNVAIIFEDAGIGFAASSTIDADGKYQLRSQYGNGIPPGEYLVSLSLPSTKGEFGVEIPLPPGTPKIPEKYQSPQTSGLKAIVKQDGDKTFNFDLD